MYYVKPNSIEAFYLIGIALIIFSAISGYHGYNMLSKENKIMQNPGKTTATITVIVLDQHGGADDRVSEIYKLEYAYNGNLYAKDLNFDPPDYYDGEKVEILVNRDDPDIYMIPDARGYMFYTISSLALLIPGILLLIHAIRLNKTES